MTSKPLFRSSSLIRGLLKASSSNITAQNQVRYYAINQAAEYFSSKPHDSLKDIHVLTLHRNPVNSLDLDFLRGIPRKISQLEEDETCKGIIIQSSCPNVFSAGLDIKQMIGQEREYLLDLADALQRFWEAIYGTDLITICAANGHVLAGGTLIALSCDYRLMNENATIGMPEVHLGIVVPLYAREMIALLIGRRQAEWALTIGHGIRAPLAGQLGLIDEVVQTEEELNRRAEEVAKHMVALNQNARVNMKAIMRQPLLVWNNELRKENQEQMTELISTPMVQSSLRAYLKRLQNKEAHDAAASKAR